MAAVRVGINGFGRIGRIVLRVLAQRPEQTLGVLRSQHNPCDNLWFRHTGHDCGEVQHELCRRVRDDHEVGVTSFDVLPQVQLNFSLVAAAGIHRSNHNVS